MFRISMPKSRLCINLAFDVLPALAALFICIGVGGCGNGGSGGYSNAWLYPDDVSSVYVKMFDTGGFRRGHEYVLTDSVCKLIEAQTPYKIVSDRDFADTELSGKMNASEVVLAGERFTGKPLERQTTVLVQVSWKNLKTGKILINNETVGASASYSQQMNQDFDYAVAVASNRAAQKVVELMQEKW